MPLSLMLLTLLGCPRKADTGDPDTSRFLVTVTPAVDVPTVLVVEWDVDSAVTAAHVEIGTDTAYGRVATADVTGEGPYRTLVFGQKGSSDYHLRVVAETAEGELTSEDVVATTGPVPSSLPDASVEERGEHFQGYIVTSFMGTSPGAVIYDMDGDIVWWNILGQGGDPGVSTASVVSRAALSLDGRAMYYVYNNVLGLEGNGLYRIDLDGGAVTSRPLSYGHHDFVELPDGTVAYLAFDPREFDGETIFGDRIMEIAPDDTVTEVYNIWAHYSYEGNESNPEGIEWPHANALDYLPEEDAYMVGFLSLGSILKIDRQTGQTLSTLGGERSDYTYMGDTMLFAYQHQFYQDGDRVAAFVNGGMRAGANSRVQEFQLNPNKTVTETWSYWPEPSLNCTNLGDVELLPSGNRLVTFSVSGEIHEVQPDGQVVWILKNEIGGAIGYSHSMADLDLGAR